MKSSGQSLLVLSDVEVRYPGGGAPAVLSASFALEPGEIGVVVGSNGAGKTSLVRAIAGFLPSEGVTTRGSIRLAGREIRGVNPARVARRGVCFIPERRKVFRDLSVEKNLRLFGKRRRSGAGLNDDMLAVFEMFPWMEERRGTLAGYLSGGEQQMLALSGAVLARPDLIIVDEPSLGLAPVVVQQVMKRLVTIRDEFNATVLLVDQNVSSTVVIADRVFSMHAGELAEENRDHVLTRSRSAGYARPRDVQEARGSERIHAASGAAEREPILTAESVSLSFGGLAVLEDVSFEIYPMEIVGLIGPNGAGKTALLNCLTGFYRPQSGHIRYAARELVGLRTSTIARLGISRTFQEAANMALVGARDLMLLGREQFLPAGVLKYATPWIRRAEQHALESVRTTAQEIGILDHVDRNSLLDELPYGHRKVADFGRALVCEPRLLLMDEPLAGLHRDEKHIMASLIRRTQERRTITQVIVDHDLEFVSAICDRLIVLNAGKKVAEGDVNSVLAMQEVVESYIGVSVEKVTEGFDMEDIG